METEAAEEKKIEYENKQYKGKTVTKTQAESLLARARNEEWE